MLCHCATALALFLLDVDEIVKVGLHEDALPPEVLLQGERIGPEVHGGGCLTYSLTDHESAL